MKKLLLFAPVLFFCLVSCKSRGTLLPSISGKAGEVLVVMEKPDWQGQLGDSVRASLEDEYPYLPVFEPCYNLINVTHANFVEMFQVHRNIIVFDVNPQIQKPGIRILKDQWAAPQIVINISAYTDEDALNLFSENNALIMTSIEQAERDRVVRNTFRYENRDVAAEIKPVFGGTIHAPSGWKVRKLTRNFAWIQYDTKKSTQGLFLYRYPVEGDDMLRGNIIKNRNRVMKANVPGPDEGSYMKTAEFWEPKTEFIKYKGRNFAQTHAWWDLEGAFMGGPFVSHAFYSPDGSEVIVVEAWVYAPKTNKRQLLRQTESLLYTWEWE